MTHFRVLLQEEKNRSPDTPLDPSMTSPWTTTGAEGDGQLLCTHPRSAPPRALPFDTRLSYTPRPQLPRWQHCCFSDPFPSGVTQHTRQTGQRGHAGHTRALERQPEPCTPTPHGTVLLLSIAQNLKLDDLISKFFLLIIPKMQWLCQSGWASFFQEGII